MFYKLKNAFNVYCLKKCKNPVLLLGTPYFNNAGDNAQTVCIEKWIKENFASNKLFSFEQLFLTMNDYHYLKKIAKAIRKDVLVFVQSGYMSNVYQKDELFNRQLVSTFKSNRIVFLPKTISYSNDKDLVLTASFFNKHPSLVFVARDFVSERIAKSFFVNSTVLSNPDFVTSLIGNYHLPPKKKEGILLCLRNDKESAIDGETRKKLKSELEKIASVTLFDTTTHIDMDIVRKNRSKYVKSIIEKFSEYQLIITDRYHGTIFSLISNTHVIIISTSDHKLEGGIKWFPQHFSRIYSFINLNNACQNDNKSLLIDRVSDSAKKMISDSYEPLDNYMNKTYFTTLKKRIGL